MIHEYDYFKFMKIMRFGVTLVFSPEMDAKIFVYKLILCISNLRFSDILTLVF